MKILLLTDVPPSPRFPGTILTQKLCSFLPENSWHCVAVLDKQLDYIKNDPFMNDNPVLYIEKPAEHYASLFGVPIGRLTFLKEEYVRIFRIPEIIRQIVEYAGTLECDRIWCILNGQTMIRIAWPVAERLGIPLRVQIWDHPVWWIVDNRLDRLTSRAILRDYDRCIGKSISCGTGSSQMADEYGRKYPGVRFFPLISCLDREMLVSTERVDLSGHKEIRIGIAGQLYAAEAFDILMQSLNSVKWEISGKKIRIVFLGSALNLKSRSEVHIEYLGYRSQAETIEIMSACDILYCPYIFAEKLELVSRYSFPSKLVTYLAAGKPVVFHGPDYSAPAAFLRQNNAGILCHTLNAGDILSCLESILGDGELYNRLIANGRKAFLDHLTTERLKEHFENFMGIAGGSDEEFTGKQY